jgi:NADPH:quinone reductase-like Zn-dependent oxidoreductase
MKVVRLADSSQTPMLVEDDAPRPRPGPGELLVRVRAAGVIPTELGWYPTSHTKTGEKRTRAVPSHEFSGVVAAVGEQVGSLEVGHEVFGMNDWYSDGAMAEYCIAPYFGVAPKPRALTHVEAASIPISALTAWQGLFDHAKLQSGEHVLVHGAAGAVGTFAVQLARFQGARVVATASADNAEFVKSLGAERVIDYRASRFEDCVKDMDVVFDTVGGETLERSWSVLKPQGRMVTIVSEAENTSDERVRRAFFIVEPSQKQLIEVGCLLDDGTLRPVVGAVVPLPEAPGVFAGKVSKVRGKLVITITNEQTNG